MNQSNEMKPVRLLENGLAVYIWPDRPDWCVPNPRGDFILASLLADREEADIVGPYAQRFGDPEPVAWAHVHQFAGRFADMRIEPYAGRGRVLSLDGLRECWIHLTNRCNARCTHCMFCSSPEDTAELDPEAVLSVMREACALGCNVFYFTGGEPFVHPGIFDVCETILRETQAHIVILTNAVGADRFLARMRDWDRGRVHLQASLDGLEANHDRVRGRGAYQRLLRDVTAIRRAGFPVTLATAVHRHNVDEMPALVSVARDLGVGNLHYLWLFIRGNTDPALFATPEEIYPRLIAAAETAEEAGVLIDNIEILKSQVFALPRTRFDLSNAGWESIAIGPDGGVYPSPALVGEARAFCGHIGEGLEEVWRTSPTLERLRASSIATSLAYRANPLAYLVGGGDVDHSLARGGAFTGHDPYVELYNRVALWLIAREAARFPAGNRPGLRLRMGDFLHECGEDGRGVFFTHSNCVLSLPRKDGHALARDFYAEAARAPVEDILNPVQYADEEIAFVPEEARVRSYGCGSPVKDARPAPGETVVDLGSGAGVECFIAASQVGPEGRVIGVDMLPEMLGRARRAAVQVGVNLGYRNVAFYRALLEALPLASDSVDVVTSNCVLNLSPHKRQAFQEILRVLKPGGRLVISDVASEDEIPIEIQYNEKLRGECLGGAFRQDRLFQLLADVGFRHAAILKRFPYRNVRGHQFFSITYTAFKPPVGPRRRVMYPGPFAAVITDDGQIVERGAIAGIPWRDGTPREGAGAFLLDDAGRIANADIEAACDCCVGPEERMQAETAPGADGYGACCVAPEAPAPSIAACCTAPEASPTPAVTVSQKHRADCMVCGAPLHYFDSEREETCHYCGRAQPTDATCEKGHFVCDACHSKDGFQIIETVCLHSTERDLIALFDQIRSHYAIPVHGPEHHAMVPAIIVTAYRNSGGDASDADIRTAVKRGAKIAGGACGFLGVCGGAAGVATGFGVLLGANPLRARERQQIQQTTVKVLERIAQFEAARCCQRDCWVALRAAAELSHDILPMPLQAEASLLCRQFKQNKECIHTDCPLWPPFLPSPCGCG